MKLTKKLKAEILKVYNAYWDSFFSGDLRAFASMLDASVQIIGSSENEIFRNKASAVKFYKATAGQVAGKTALRNRKISLRVVANSVMITEQSDFYALIDGEWTLYGHGRISTLMHKTGKAWKIIYEHGSLPDSKAGEGEQINTERIKAENLQLRDAVKRRTIELEHKNRELEIEASLERVRAVAMSMMKSDDLLNVCKAVFTELRLLGFAGADLRNTQIVINNDDKASYYGYQYSDYTGGEIAEVPYDLHPTIRLLRDKLRQSDEAFADIEISGAALDEWKPFVKSFPQKPDEKLNAANELHYYFYSVGIGALGISSFTTLPEEKLNILKRLRNVFDLSYQRYTDIALAETQAREAQIEAALERVRARTMAMQKSDELAETASLLFKQINDLGIQTWTSGFNIWEENDTSFIGYNPTPSGDIAAPYHIPSTEDSFFINIYEAKKRGEDFFVFESAGESLVETYHYMKTLTVVKDVLKGIEGSGFQLPTFQINHCAFFSHGFLLFITLEAYPKAHDIFKRFGKVFEQTYTRFLDLQNAEAQTREAQIQLALERVRAKAMSMQNSDELNEVLSVMFEQFDILGIEPKSVYLSLMDIENNQFSFRLTGIKGERNIGEQIIDLNEMPNWAEVVDKWKNSEPHSVIFIEYPPELLPKYWGVFHDSIHSLPEHARMQMEDFPDGLFGTGGHNKFGYIGFYHSRRATGEEVNILIRIAREFEGLYQRFLDLQKAEAHAREAEQQASLDRVRAEIASMRTAGDLQRITPLIWRELTTLGVPFFRCGIFINDEATGHTHAYLSTPTGEAVAALRLRFDSTPAVEQAVQHWRQQQVYREEWNREQFIAWTQSILKQGLIDGPEKYQGGGEAPEKLVLHFVPFTQGMLYVGSSAALSEDEIALSQSIAKAFGMAYARYEDFQRLEAAKAQVEAALENLKKTQQQLVTQEKLASLGQLTAGIAHEIKNPLNFVNNFAALSVDLVKELREEIVKRKTKNVNGDAFENMEEIIAMLEQNAEKINHHGKRADGIVKSMMQHARGSSGQREPADINRLLDEAVNLVYHGMRANDGSFIVIIEKEYDETIGKLEVVPQDLSRVFLNIINNACYAAFQKQKTTDKERTASFSPTLSVSSKDLGHEIEIRIRDNGNGIPPEIRDRIFNPFFTTKPTGQGTGLGLSISYDIIVQQHRGEIKVETEEGKFTEFVVWLPKKA